ncbi:hypothetical protein MSHO_22420 [Mycobacterium shottsii]|uniref:Uncharacterized protein n=1 Tax=Mycobacterium shottsii TaxID=133549 RepID=A0A7I7LB87_9MYCO|nr:hypothetical protein [Mycobacterium shottsii]BBX56897.1 hypothetical protein MSHO_22420 [Mycobacterium shottsii]
MTDKGFDIGNTQSLVTPVFLQMDPLLTLEFLNRMRHEHNVFCSGVMYPVVPPGLSSYDWCPPHHTTPPTWNRQ